MEQIKYSIYKPAGNDTALVYGTNYTKDQKKKINNVIMERHANIEQVGFISNANKELQMAGGEFCGNATRSAAYNFLNGTNGSIKILVNSKDVINAGVDNSQNAWCEIPLCKDKNVVTKEGDGIYIVKIKGITLVVFQDFIVKKYIDTNYDLKEKAMQIIKKYKLENNSAVGVIFCENEDKVIRITPVVWVKNINTLFVETACGSGSIAVCIVEAFLKKQSVVIDIEQPSGLIITSKVSYEKGKFSKAIISGNIENDGQIYYINL